MSDADTNGDERGPRAARPRPASPPPSATGAGVLLSLWALACVLMLVVAVSNDRAPGWALPPGSNAARPSSVRSSVVYAPSFDLNGPKEVPVESADSKATISLVETLPVGDFNVTATAPETFDALFARVQAATMSIDISAMYWCVPSVLIS